MSTELLEQVVLLVHLVLALAIIGLIMLQQGKGAEMGASFGAGASQTLFGSSGSGNVLTRATAWMVALFFATSFGLAVLAKQKTDVQDALGIPLPTSTERSAVQGEMPEAVPAAAPEAEPLEDLPALDAPAEPEMRSDGATGDGASGDLPSVPE